MTALFFVTGARAGQRSDAHYRIKQPVVTFDLWKYFKKAKIEDSSERANVIYLVTSLQGIVNRDKPRLFLFASLALFDEESRWRYLPIDNNRRARELDEFWFKQFLAKGYFQESQVRQIDSPEDLISYFRSEIKGWVLWTSNTPATVNVAMMAAGADNLLPVGADLDHGKLLQRLRTAFPETGTGLDLTLAFTGKGLVSLAGIVFPSTGSAKNDAYQYAIRAYQKKGKLDPKYMWYDCDAALWGSMRQFYGGDPYRKYGDRAEVQNDGLYNADYWISKRAFVFDLSPWPDEAPTDDPRQTFGTDWSTWNDILETSYHQRKGQFGVCGGFMPWWVKYTDLTGGKHEPVDGEWQFVKLLTSYNIANDSDAAFGVANCSFYQHLPKLSVDECKVTFPPPLKLESGVSYICVFMMDYDGSAWLNQMAVSIYDDPARGRYPLNWTINPILQQRVPQAFRYLYENRTPQDFFGLEDDGAGYIYPPMLMESNRIGRIQDAGIGYYQNFATKLHRRFGTQYTCFYISRTLDKPWLKMAAKLSPKGFGHNTPDTGLEEFDGTPIICLHDSHVSQKARFEKKMEGIFSQASGEHSSTVFQACRCILWTPSQIAEVFDKLKKNHPTAKVKIVDAATFFDLKRQSVLP